MNKRMMICLIMLTMIISYFAYRKHAYIYVPPTPEQIDLSLFKAVHKGDTNQIKKLLNSGYDVNQRIGEKYTPLHFALNQPTAQILLENGADLRARTSGQRTPLITAINNARYDVAEYLLEQGADPNFCMTESVYPLKAAIDMHWIQMIELLLRNGADPNFKPRTILSRSPLLHTVEMGNLDIFLLLAEYGGDIHSLNYKGANLLHSAEDVEIARCLISNGLDPNQRSIFDYTSPIHNITDVETLESLLESGADISARDWEGQTAIFKTSDI